MEAPSDLLIQRVSNNHTLLKLIYDLKYVFLGEGEFLAKKSLKPSLKTI